MNIAPECIITGCALVDQSGGSERAVHGDLYRAGDTFIFNAVLNDKGEAAWRYDGADRNDSLAGDRRTAYIHAGEFFERRGVIVFSKQQAMLNAAALKHICNFSF